MAWSFPLILVAKMAILVGLYTLLMVAYPCHSAWNNQHHIFLIHVLLLYILFTKKDFTGVLSVTRQ